ncbi:glycoside hydrolase family 2 protein [Poriferisphaera sp. WC338]|uniref:glycoside hydrolase family 2 protein n=1 Tax=Poriferisphaera sp. WC338 TaxID=3425129 RepID=UPI003D81B505
MAVTSYCFFAIALIAGFAFFSEVAAAAPNKLQSRWAKDVNPSNTLPEYPRPQLARENWTNLNGRWQYAITAALDNQPKSWDGQILVPFAIESKLSGVQKPLLPNQALWYNRTLNLTKPTNNDRTLLHFGAVDWHATVYVNNQKVGEHRGGFTPFTCDITSALNNTDTQTLTVRVWDPTDQGSQPRGKQVLKPEGIYYTAVSGIWQTVWLETVPNTYITSLKITPDFDNRTVNITTNTNSPAGDLTINITTAHDDSTISSYPNAPVALSTKNCEAWSPDEPNLYDFTVELKQDGKVIDTVTSYFAQRKIHFQKDDGGINRLYLNNEPLFQYGPLDQGWWPAGLFTAPTDEALRYDIEITKAMGFNMTRKHVKIEPARWYYHADKLGLLVWQDMPTLSAAGHNQGIPPHGSDINATAQLHNQFTAEWKEIIDTLYNSPSIVIWVPFNEGWGQHQTNEVMNWTMDYDPTRLVDGPSGWVDRGVGHLKDMHNYPAPNMFPTMPDRVSALGEFGGISLLIKNHLWQRDNNWGYIQNESKEEFLKQYNQYMLQLRSLIDNGLAAAVYTQITDVEIETNGLLTYDRDVIKIDPGTLKEIHAPLYRPAMKQKVIVPSAKQRPQKWRYTDKNPGSNWFRTNFNDNRWKIGSSGFGTSDTPNTIVNTTWNTGDIWLRKDIKLSEKELNNNHEWQISIFHDENATVYINGILALQTTGYTTTYINMPIRPEAIDALKPGKNTIAVHCHQTDGGQYIDLGLIQLVP